MDATQNVNNPQATTQVSPQAAPQSAPQAEPVPQGYTMEAEPVPSGYTMDGGQTQQTQQQSQPSNETELPGHALANTAIETAKGFGKGILDTVHGVGSMIHSGGEIIHKGLGEYLVPEQGQAALDQMSTPQGVAQKIGYGGETLMEFLLGDEALKGLSLADKLAKSAKIAKLLEGSPRVMKALQMGADVSKAMGQLSPEAQAVIKNNPVLARLIGTGMDAIRQGAVQAVQTTTKTGGDIGQGVKEGAIMTGASGAIGVPLATVGGLLSKAGAASETMKKMADIAEGAPAKSDVAENAKNMVGAAEKQMHSDFQSGIDEIKDALQHNEIDLKGSPLQKAAEDIIGASKDTHPLDKLAGDTAPVSEGARKYIKGIANALEKEAKPEKPLGEFEEGVDDLLRDQTPKETTEPVKVNIDNLIKARQTLSERMRSLGWDSAAERADRNAYSKMIDGVDDSIQKLIDSSGATTKSGADPAELYQTIRNNYKQTKALFNDPEVRTSLRNISKGNLDDVGRELTTGTKAGHKIDVLSQIIGPRNMNRVSDQIFQTWVDDASKELSSSGEVTSTRFNPDKLIQKWTGLKPEVREKLFEMTPARADAYNQLMSELGNTSSVKKLVKYGLLPVTLGTAGAVHGPLAALVGALAGLGADVGFGLSRNILDHVANSPLMWRTLGAVSKAGGALESSKAASVAMSAGKVGITKGLGELGSAAQSYYQNDKVGHGLKKAYNYTSSALGGSTPSDQLPDPSTFH